MKDGWRFGTVAEFLELTPEEEEYIEKRLRDQSMNLQEAKEKAIELLQCPFCGQPGVKTITCGQAIPNCERCCDIFGCINCDLWLDTLEEWNRRTETALKPENTND